MIPNSAQVVIAGAGIAGASIAYHLTRLGCTDVVVLEQGELVGGTTSHAPGLVGQLRSSPGLTRMLMDSVSLYRELSVDGVPGFHEVGSLRVASSRERWQELKRQEAFARGMGLPASLISPEEAIELFPLMSLDHVTGALYLPSDGSAVAPILTQALIDRAQAAGARFYSHHSVEAITVKKGRVCAVITAGMHIEIETLVVAAGIWSPHLGRMAGVALPLIPMQHQYAATIPLSDLPDQVVPNLRDPDHLVYLRQDGQSMVLGGYERNPEPYPFHTLPTGPNPTILPFDPGRFASLHQSAVQRVPALHGVPLSRQVNGLESFTSDGEFLLGPSGNVKGFWCACGFCAHGVSGAGGVGKAIAEWIVQGEPQLDLWHMDVRRIGAYATGRGFIQQRVREVYSTYYDILYPGHERQSARRLRMSPMAEQLQALGASWGEKAGWERPNWFGCNAERTRIPYQPRGWPGRLWSPAIGAEHLATRATAGLFDVTSFSKLEIMGPGALGLLQFLSANEMDRPCGSITYTQMLNRHGGIECDLTVTRLEENRFMLITGTAFGGHDLSWIRQHLPDDGATQALDVTSSHCCVGLWGPRARDVLQQVTDDDVSNEAFPYLTAHRIMIGAIPVQALRVTYVGELGWELYTPMEYGRALWQMLWEAGQDFEIVPAGYRAIESLRLEKGYRYWSTDIHSEYTPYEAGLGFAVRLNKGPFLGRDALIRQREQGVRRKLCCFILEDPTTMVLGGEPLLNGTEVVGRITSGGYGFTVEQSIAYGYMPAELAEPGTRVDVLWFGERIAATVMREPLFDPKNTRIKERRSSCQNF